MEFLLTKHNIFCNLHSGVAHFLVLYLYVMLDLYQCEVNGSPFFSPVFVCYVRFVSMLGKW